MKIYTRGGDGGETSLLAGGRVPKDDPRVEAYGTVDEANACIGVARAAVLDIGRPGEDRDLLLHALDRVQDGLMRLCSDLASGGMHPVQVSDTEVEALEGLIDQASHRLPGLGHFLVPGASRAEAALHVARTVVRRAERRVVHLGERFGPSPVRIRFLNRVSDLLFVLARLALAVEGIPERPWRP
ncbi:MAG TPA: cob(I)yrinic acid a,c-diamide adenosyltransferase [Myxococcota bacterium]|nr:cob(I)yrinic acid a,c-diamide adenosyltransferase [Myxococcota bacterium]HQK51374.1 cob(I)yrinic acid a,c-diamide adenosyltransferase [Myxococcota bacterium]